jgi:hypothetical protein
MPENQKERNCTIGDLKKSGNFEAFQKKFGLVEWISKAANETEILLKVDSALMLLDTERLWDALRKELVTVEMKLSLTESSLMHDLGFVHSLTERAGVPPKAVIDLYNSARNRTTDITVLLRPPQTISDDTEEEEQGEEEETQEKHDEQQPKTAETVPLPAPPPNPAGGKTEVGQKPIVVEPANSGISGGGTSDDTTDTPPAPE